MTRSRIIYIALIYCFLSAVGAMGQNHPSHPDSSPVESEDSDSGDSSPPDVDERIGLTFNRAQSQAVGPGGQAGSNSVTYGHQAGILNTRTNNYLPLHSKFGGYSNQFSTGPAPPNAWSGSNSYGSPGGSIGGRGNAGFSGGVGSANVISRTKTIAIPLGNDMVLLSALKSPSNSSSHRKSLSIN